MKQPFFLMLTSGLPVKRAWRSASQTVDFEAFRSDLEKALAYSDRSKSGRPPFDPVLMFKILVIQTLNNLSNERTEYLINDRLSFMHFLGLELSDRVPDAKTVWLCHRMIRQRNPVPFTCQGVERFLYNQ